MSYYSHYSRPLATSGGYAPPTPPSSSPPTGPAADPPSETTGRQVRDIYKEQARRLNPGLTPTDDLELVLFGGGQDLSNIADIKAWVNLQRAETIEDYGSKEGAESALRRQLDEMVDTTGLWKPSSDDVNVQYLPLPDIFGGDISLRFWPGPCSHAEYYMDLVRTETREPINVPEGFHLWMIPDPEKPWIHGVSMEILSLERLHGIPPDKIIPGEEKFLLRDGMLCLLMHEKEVVVRFIVPTRPGVAGAGIRDGHPVLMPQ